MPYDPVQRHMAIEKLVTRVGSEGQVRKYYRIRPARWYGGIVTADCVGCGLVCRFCWVSDVVMNRPCSVGNYYSSKKVAESLISLARKRGLSLLRVSGGEPTIGKQHLLELLENLKGSGCRFILETNGIPIAYDEDYAESLSKFDFIHVRVSLKGCNEEEFAMLTGAKKEGFKLQLEALRRLVEANVSCHPAVMTSFSSRESFQKLAKEISQISQSLAEEIEVEELILYPHVVRRLRAYNIKFYSGYSPESVPKELI
ncbi:MAG: radical SAM protein [Candidatus Bathyarchaeia archaeon]